ncbi:nitroreductase family deazaflavin-dependent oxidoreductase [Micromonospora sp. NPDC051006]|uniref:nitroreductase family deazaflavin-dependent oxidoreductase n=1 Tax=Micromonospora sp. NPDC051006 TaxID=3364283 RepID=UPI0037ACDB87
MVAMVLPRRLARFNRVVTNRVTGPLAGWLPGFAVVIHGGRRSGREYRPPINIFRTSDGYVAALTYGVTDWANNVLAAGGCALEIRGRQVPLTRPRLVHDPTRRDMPPVVRQLVGMIGVTDFLYLRTAPDADNVEVSGVTSRKSSQPADLLSPRRSAADP